MMQWSYPLDVEQIGVTERSLTLFKKQSGFDLEKVSTLLQIYKDACPD